MASGAAFHIGSGILFPPNELQAYTNYYVNLFEYNGIEEDPAFNTTPVQGFIGDSIPPTMLCKNIIVELDETGNASITALEVDNGSYDECGIDSLSIDLNSFNCADLGDNIVTLSAIDFFGIANRPLATNRSLPFRTSEESLLPPNTRLRAVRIIVFPAPVSPVKTVRPLLNSRDA